MSGTAFSLTGVGVTMGTTSVLHSIDVHLPAGEALAIIGSSGAGKTTLARVVGGLTLPTVGNAQVLGMDTTDEAAVAAVRPRIGMTLQGGSLFDELTLEDNLRLGAGAASAGSWRAVQGRVDRLLYAFGLEDVGNPRVAELSVGTKRQLEIVRALLREPELLILDEPFEGAAAETTAMVQAIQRSLRRHRGALLVLTQDHSLAALLADRRIELRHGRLLQHDEGASLPFATSSANALATAPTLI